MNEHRHIPWNISDEKRLKYSISSSTSQRARHKADEKAAQLPEASLTNKYNPNKDMKLLPSNGLKALSLFSGGGGLDLGFERAGYDHLGSYEILDFAGDTLKHNRKKWHVSSGLEDGDVRNVDWSSYLGKVDILHGGPPCQPFSIAGRRNGSEDNRDMFPEFRRAVQTVKPKVFMAENVLGFLSKRFSEYKDDLIKSLSKEYQVFQFKISSASFGVPQDRQRAILIGVHKDIKKTFDHNEIQVMKTPRYVRAALGLSDIGYDSFAPTLRCTLSGPRQTTSIANSTASVVKWTKLGIWPHGVSPNRSVASQFPTKNNTYRLCVEECQLLQGFPLNWKFEGPVYKRLGMVGNSVCPPVAYNLAKAIREQLL